MQKDFILRKNRAKHEIIKRHKQSVKIKSTKNI